MTGYTVHTGSSIKFSGGWDRIFSGTDNAKSPAKKKSKVVEAKKAATKKPAKKKASKKKK